MSNDKAIVRVASKSRPDYRSALDFVEYYCCFAFALR